MTPLKTPLEHLKDLGRSIFFPAILTGVVFLLSLFASDIIISNILKYLEVEGFVFSPFELTMTKVYVSMCISLVSGILFLSFGLYQFCKELLNWRSRVYLCVMMVLLLVGFVAGSTYVSKLLLPLLLSSEYVALLSIKEIIKYAVIIGSFTAVMGLCIPLLPLLTQMQLFKPEWIKNKRKYLFMGVIVAVGILTPMGDAFSMMALGVPIYLSVEVGNFIAKMENENYINKC
jgi:Sec-independent protein secretion pathway component TatC